jgi:hypothetical protein
VLVAVVALAGCGSSSHPTWDGPPAATGDGTVAVAGFNAFVESHPDSALSAEALAAEFLRLDRRNATRTLIRTAGHEAADRVSIVVELDGLLDDSVRSVAYLLVARKVRDDGWRLVSAHRTQRCHPGRGHQGFSVEPCI